MVLLKRVLFWLESGLSMVVVLPGIAVATVAIGGLASQGTGH
jgi:hypothetical protein